MKTVIDLLPFVIGGYEVIARTIPTRKDRTVIGNIFKGLVILSEMLNRGRGGK
jgi:hypothetical protein